MLRGYQYSSQHWTKRSKPGSCQVRFSWVHFLVFKLVRLLSSRSILAKARFFSVRQFKNFYYSIVILTGPKQSEHVSHKEPTKIWITMSPWTASYRSSQFSFKPAKQPATKSLQAHWVVTGACQHRAVPCWCASSIESYFKQSAWIWSLGASLFVWIRWFSPWPLLQKRHSCMLPLALIKKSLVFAFKLKFPY